jgi:hypothetical protein
MGDVFKNAEAVVVWLGKDEDCGSTATALNSMEAILHHCYSKIGNLQTLDDVLWKKGYGQYLLKRDFQVLPPYDWRAMETFFSAPWFQRLWVIQEVCLAKSAICAKDEYVVPWRDIGLASTWLLYCGYDGGTDSRRIISGVWNAQCIYKVEQDLKRATLELGYLLSRISDFETTRLLDKVFGFYGLLYESANASLDILKPITPDYSDAAHSCEVYTRATRAAITQNFLSILTDAYPSNPHDCKYDEHPSWVPRFDLSLREDIGEADRGFFDQGASNGAKVWIRPQATDTNVLSLRGVLVDTINILGKPLSNEILEPAHLAEMSKEHHSCLRETTLSNLRLANTYGHLCSQESELAFSLTMTAQNNCNQHDAAHDSDFHAQSTAFIHWCRGSKLKNGMLRHFRS